MHFKFLPLASSIILSSVSATLTCPDCWIANADSTACVPKAEKVALTCSGNGMSLTLDKCVMGDTSLSLLTLIDKSSSDACSTKGTISASSDNTKWQAEIPLDCSNRETITVPGTSGNPETTKIKFSQRLSALKSTDVTGIIISFDTLNSVDFSCAYNTDYDISDDYEVDASVGGLGISQDASFNFGIKRFTSDSYDTESSGSGYKVGSTMYFGVTNEAPIQSVYFTALECGVILNSDNSLVYNIMENGCYKNPNFVDFKIVNNFSPNMLKLSYKIFHFKGNTDGKMKLKCKIKVCDSSAANSVCTINAAKQCEDISKYKKVEFRTMWMGTENNGDCAGRTYQVTPESGTAFGFPIYFSEDGERMMYAALYEDSKGKFPGKCYRWGCQALKGTDYHTQLLAGQNKLETYNNLFSWSECFSDTSRLLEKSQHWTWTIAPFVDGKLELLYSHPKTVEVASQHTVVTLSSYVGSTDFGDYYITDSHNSRPNGFDKPTDDNGYRVCGWSFLELAKFHSMEDYQQFIKMIWNSIYIWKDLGLFIQGQRDSNDLQKFIMDDGTDMDFSSVWWAHSQQDGSNYDRVVATSNRLLYINLNPPNAPDRNNPWFADHPYKVYTADGTGRWYLCRRDRIWDKV